MTDLLALYQYAEDHDIDVDWFPLPVTPSLSVKLPDGSCAIGIDPWQQHTIAEEKVRLAHELGHCETDSFYDPTTSYTVRKKLENRADRWAIQRLIPLTSFSEALRAGYNDIWQLAEQFNVTEDFMRKAAYLYIHGYLSQDLCS